MYLNERFFNMETLTMFKKLGFLFLSTASLLVSPCINATQSHTLAPGITLEYEFKPNEPQVFSNFLFWAVEANCKMILEDESDVLFVEALAKTGKVNDQPMNKGDVLHVIVRSGDELKIRADSGAKVRLTNEGEHMVRAICVT